MELICFILLSAAIFWLFVWSFGTIILTIVQEKWK